MPLAKSGEFKRAFELFEKSLEIDSTNTVALNSYADALAKSGEFKRAFELFEKSSKLSISPLDIYINTFYTQKL